MSRLRSPLQLSLLSLPVLIMGCSETELRTAIKVELTSQDSIIDVSNRVILIVDPVEPFLDAYGDPITEGELNSYSSMENYISDDDELEMVIEAAVGEEGLPLIIELSEGRNTSEFSLSAAAWMDTTEVARSNTRGPLGFISETVPTYSVELALLDVPVHECNNGLPGVYFSQAFVIDGKNF